MCELVDKLVMVLNRKLLLLNVYLLCQIYFNLTLNPNDLYEPYAEVII